MAVATVVPSVLVSRALAIAAAWSGSGLPPGAVAAGERERSDRDDVAVAFLQLAARIPTPCPLLHTGQAAHGIAASANRLPPAVPARLVNWHGGRCDCPHRREHRKAALTDPDRGPKNFRSAPGKSALRYVPGVSLKIPLRTETADAQEDNLGSLWAGGRGAYRCGMRQFVDDGPQEPGQPVSGRRFVRLGEREFIRDGPDDRHDRRRDRADQRQGIYAVFVCPGYGDQVRTATGRARPTGRR